MSFVVIPRIATSYPVTIAETMLWIAAATLVLTAVIALNNFFGLKDRAVDYLRNRLCETLEDEIERRRVEKDRELFQQFLEVLPSSGSIDFIDRKNMAGFSFDSEKLDDLHEFYYNWNDAEHEFMDNELEKKCKKLHDLVGEYTSLIGDNTFPTDDGRHTVPPEWEHEQPKRFAKVVNSLHEKSRDIVETHQDLVKVGRRKLGV